MYGTSQDGGLAVLLYGPSFVKAAVGTNGDNSIAVIQVLLPH
jgi:hypothetical protein